MSPIDAVLGWMMVNLALAGGVVAGLCAWLLYVGCARRVVHWRKRYARTAKPAPAAASAPTRPPTCAVPFITDQDRIRADYADRQLLASIEFAFNREHHT